MAQLKDTVVSGNLNVSNEIQANSVQTSTIKIPTTSGSTTLGPGTAGQVIKSDGTGAYWAEDSNTDTWRSISVDGTQELGTGTDTGGVNFVGGDNVTLTYASNNITVSATNTATATGTETFVKGDATFEWDAGSAATLGTAIPADDITSWSAGTLPTVSYSDGVLYFNEGSLPSLQYTAKSIPNVTSVGTVPSLSWSTASAVTGVST